MSRSVTLGGERLGAGKKMKVDLKTYERSTHNLSYVWRSTMAAGTLVPCLCEVGIPGDTFDIDLDLDVKTHPTVGPLFGSYKVQLDIFTAPVRLYQAQLHNNKLGVGLDMAKIKLPLVELHGNPIDPNKVIDNQQINPSSIFSYLNIRGVGYNKEDPTKITKRYFNAVPWLAYWDIYKNYYANKQEEIGAVIHKKLMNVTKNITNVLVIGNDFPAPPEVSHYPGKTYIDVGSAVDPWQVRFIASTGTLQPNELYIQVDDNWYLISEVFNSVNTATGFCSSPKFEITNINAWAYIDQIEELTDIPEVAIFPLADIDKMREDILKAVDQTDPFVIEGDEDEDQVLKPYGLALQHIINVDDTHVQAAYQYNQEGLGLKTYQSDLFNNWLSSEWIDGENGINAITAIDTSDGSFTIDTLNLSRKVYDMLNRIAISGGTYDNWLEAVWDQERTRGVESPVYHGGLIRELVFQEVVSTAEADATGQGAQPLGALAGKGIMSNKRKGGSVIIRVDEPCYIIGIVSLTPRIDYSQGNKWDVNLRTMDDFHKPALDEIGFQDLVTDQMAWWETANDSTGLVQEFKSAGKQPAWINYMTNVNQVRGNFADPENEMFMTLNRRYEFNNDGTPKIKDLTTYIDPLKFNYIFAQTSRDAQNFWMQIGFNITARRKMSARIIPNL